MIKAVEIEDIELGDKILIHDGNSIYIIKCMKKLDDDLSFVSVDGYNYYPNEDGHYFVIKD